jgi:hypothetical protein
VGNAPRDDGPIQSDEEYKRFIKRLEELPGIYPKRHEEAMNVDQKSVAKAYSRKRLQMSNLAVV